MVHERVADVEVRRELGSERLPRGRGAAATAREGGAIVDRVDPRPIIILADVEPNRATVPTGRQRRAVVWRQIADIENLALANERRNDTCGRVRKGAE